MVGVSSSLLSSSSQGQRRRRPWLPLPTRGLALRASKYYYACWAAAAAALLLGSSLTLSRVFNTNNTASVSGGVGSLLLQMKSGGSGTGHAGHSPSATSTKSSAGAAGGAVTDDDSTIRIDALLVKEGIRPRAWKSWRQLNGPGVDLPCIEGKHNRGTGEPRRGFIFIKPMKASSTTGATVTLRIATRLAQRKFGTNASASKINDDRHKCRVFVRHASANSVGISKLNDAGQSWLWSIVRDPRRRTVSEYFHFYVTRQGWDAANATKFAEWLESDKINYYESFFLRWLMETKTGRPKRQPLHDAADVINAILGKYNFLAVTERMEESVVVMQLLLGLQTEDVLFLANSGKQSGGYDDGKFRDTCYKIQPARLTHEMRSVLDGPKFKKAVYWDELLHRAVSRSLDMTIDAVGRTEFETALQKFRAAQASVSEACSEQVRYPCSAEGQKRLENETDCIANDWGCGFDCIDRNLADAAH